jgi:hypothetical protein
MHGKTAALEQRHGVEDNLCKHTIVHLKVKFSYGTINSPTLSFG